MGGMFGGGNAKSPFDEMIRKNNLVGAGWDASQQPNRTQMPGGAVYDRVYDLRMNQYLKNLGTKQRQPQAAAPPPPPQQQPAAPQYDPSAADRLVFQGLGANNPYRAQLAGYFGGAG